MNTMLTGLRLGNFKAFGATQDIPIRPLTLIFGPNSAGKSSILHGLLFTCEALKTGNLNVKKPDLAADSVDLGGFKQFIHQHKLESSFTWGAEFRLPKENALLSIQPSEPMNIGVSIQISDTPLGITPHTIEISAMGSLLMQLSLRSPVISGRAKAFSRRGPQQNATNTFWGTAVRFLVSRLDWEHPLMRAHFLPTVAKLLKRNLSDSEKKKIIRVADDLTSEITALIETFVPREAELLYPEDYFPTDFRKSNTHLLNWLTNGKRWADICVASLSSCGNPSKSDYEGVAAVVLFATIDELLRKLHNLMVDAFDNLTYLGPLRYYPERNHITSPQSDDRYSKGEFAWDHLCNNAAAREKVNHWLKTMSVCYEIRPRIWRTTTRGRTPGETKAELTLTDTRNGTIVTPRDIGVGISQMLPILATACGSQNQIHAIEQPEIHIHPALQAELGDLFIESAIGQKQNTFLLETHSEHLLLRVMRRMRETSTGKLPKGIPPVKPNDVAVLYVQPDGERSIVREMPLNERGDLLKQWPGGFFEEGLKEVLPSYDR